MPPSARGSHCTRATIPAVNPPDVAPPVASSVGIVRRGQARPARDAERDAERDPPLAVVEQLEHALEADGAARHVVRHARRVDRVGPAAMCLERDFRRAEVDRESGERTGLRVRAHTVDRGAHVERGEDGHRCIVGTRGGCERDRCARETGGQGPHAHRSSIR